MPKPKRSVSSAAWIFVHPRAYKARVDVDDPRSVHAERINAVGRVPIAGGVAFERMKASGRVAAASGIVHQRLKTNGRVPKSGCEINYSRQLLFSDRARESWSSQT